MATANARVRTSAAARALTPPAAVFPLLDVNGQPPPSVPEAHRVIRKDVRELSKQEEERLVKALKQMMKTGWKAKPASTVGTTETFTSRGKSTEIAITCEYFRLASYHGWYKSYCAHGMETFPGWHRAYLIDFETTLQAADDAVRGGPPGPEGRIHLPYWGWERGPVNGQMYPALMRREFSSLDPAMFSSPNELTRLGFSLMTDDTVLARFFTDPNAVQAEVRRALQQFDHTQVASTGGNRLGSVETSHNSVHGVLKFPMSSVTWAAFHPIFFMHHCNVDRLYEAYLNKDMNTPSLNGEGAPWNEFIEGGRALYNTPLDPFKHPATGGPFMPFHTFLTKNLGYSYDSLPPIPPQRMTAPPTLALFDDIDPNALPGRSYELHVFAMGEAEAEAFAAPEDTADFWDVPSYAGVSYVFGAQELHCDNCLTRDPVDVAVDITDVLQRQGLSRHQAVLRVVVLNANDGSVVEYGSSGLPEPKVVGPFFEDPQRVMRRVAEEGPSAVEAGDTLQLQRYLAKFGWYSGVLDGVYGEATEQAVRAFQRKYGLQPDGVAGPQTLALMTRTRLDDKEDEVEVDDRPRYTAGDVVRWWAGRFPGYLPPDFAKDEIEEALKEWAKAVPLVFIEVAAREDADLAIVWDNRTADNMFRFDGRGGALAFAQDGAITLDSAEYWLLQGKPPAEGAFYLLPVILHEIGHVLGLTHSECEEDVMSPFYVADRVRLAANDRARVQRIYPMQQEMEALFGTLDQDQDGVLTREEFVGAVSGVGAAPLNADEASAMFDQFLDPAGPGGLRLREFVQLMSHLYFG